MSDEALKNAVLAALAKVAEPVTRKDVVALELIKDASVKDGRVSFTIEFPSPSYPSKKALEDACLAAAQQVAGVKGVAVRTSAVVRARPPVEGSPFGPGVKNIVAVGSGKGGVGKSTVSANLACALAQEGARVGLMDLDVWGPNIPLMMGAPKDAPPLVTPERRILPHVLHGVKVMSIGFFLKDDEPVIWRGAMVHGAIRQFSTDVEWGEIDYLLIDLPPGTGDVQISMAQGMPLTGAVVVSTPQDVALLDVAKSIAMFKKVGVPILGLVENMSFFVCPSCHVRHEIFHHGGAQNAAAKWGHEFLGAVPIDMEIRIGGDAGTPIVVKNPKSPHSEAFRGIARNLAGRVWAAAAGAAKSDIMGEFMSVFKPPQPAKPKPAGFEV